MAIAKWNLYPGMIVIHNGKTARVEKINPKKIIVLHEDGGRWNTYADHLTEAPEGTVFNIDEAAGLTLGVPVRFKEGSTNRIKHPHVFVITGRNQAMFSMAKLGGDDGRYFTKISGSMVEIAQDVIDSAAL